MLLKGVTFLKVFWCIWLLILLALGSFDMEIIEKGGAKGVNHFANISSMAFKMDVK